MNNTSLKQKLSLIVFGLFLTIILLEISLRAAGAVVFYLQERQNHVSLNKNEYRILCLGESTTALGGEDSYPSQLARMLNEHSTQKDFTVINQGIISTTTEYILAHADQNLNTYKPQLVIVMMGINDKAYLHDPNKTLWWENIKSFFQDFRVYKLWRLLYERISHQIKEVDAPVQPENLSQTDDGHDQQAEDFLEMLIVNDMRRISQHISAEAQYRKNHQEAQSQNERQFLKETLLEVGSACIELARRYRFQGLFQRSRKLLEQATLLIPNDTDLYQEWGEFYLAQGESAQAAKAFQASFALDNTNNDVLRGLAHAYYQEHNARAFFAYDLYLHNVPKDYWGYIELARWLKETKNDGLAEKYLKRAIEIQPDFEQAYIDLGEVFADLGQYAQQEAFYLQEISLHPKINRLYQALGEFYKDHGKEDLSEKYFQQAAVHQMAEYYPVTLVNYKLLLDKILSRHIQVIVMQYPLRDISPLENYLGQRKDVIYVENEENFKKALAQGSYHQYFKDNFAYNFGHCTRAGNALIARNLTDVILNKVGDLH